MQQDTRALPTSIQNGYVGVRFDETVYRDPIVVNRISDGQQTPLLHYEEYAPAGFDWGNKNDGASDLALSILIDFVGDEEVAMFLHKRFRDVFVAHFGTSWEISDDSLNKWVGTHYMTKQQPYLDEVSDLEVKRIVERFRAGETGCVIANSGGVAKVVQSCAEQRIAVAVIPLIPRHSSRMYEIRVLSNDAGGVLSPWTLIRNGGASILTDG